MLGGLFDGLCDVWRMERSEKTDVLLFLLLGRQAVVAVGGCLSTRCVSSSGPWLVLVGWFPNWWWTRKEAQPASTSGHSLGPNLGNDPGIACRS